MTLRDGSGLETEGFDALLEAARAGERWACTAIWREYAAPVQAFLNARGSREAEDLTSEVFLAVFDRLPTFAGTEPDLRSFIFSVAYRRLVDELRKRSRHGETDEWSEVGDTRQTASAEDEALGRIGEASALSLLEGLPIDQRNVMVLRIAADLTLEQVALVLGKRPGAVKALQHRALESLRKKVSPNP